MISPEIDSDSFRLLVKEVIEKVYGGNLVEFAAKKISSDGMFFDFADLKNNIYVDIKENGSGKYRKNAFNQIQNWVTRLEHEDDGNIYYAVFENDLSNEDKEYYNRIFETIGISGERLKILDKAWIIKAAIDKKIGGYRLENANESQKQDNQDLEKLINSNKNFFAVGHLWDDNSNDQMDRFIEKGIWENGYETKHSKTVNSVKEGDVLYLKSTFTGTLRVKAIGVVTENPKDGRLLRVNWHLINKIDLPKLGAYRDTITKIGDENVKRILEGLHEQLPELFEIIKRLDIVSKIDMLLKPIELDIKYFSEKNVELVRTDEFYFEKAQDVLEELKTYDDLPDGFADLKEIKKVASKKISSYEQLNIQWENRGSITPKEFIDYLKKEEPELIPLYERISKFISYVDKSAWNKKEYNEYSDNRVIAKTGVRQPDLVSHFLGFALNGFNIEPKRVGYVFSNTIEYLNNPAEKFNILSKKHRPLISKYFLGRIYDGDAFHSELKNYFEKQYQLSVVNPKNLTCFYTIIIYNASIKNLWDIDGGDPPTPSNPLPEEPENGDDKIPFHLDQVVSEDKLGRDPVAKVFTDLIKKDIFNHELPHSFMVHLQGKWGAGKSSFLELIKNNLNSDEKEQWIIVDYNAWQNQHIEQPWWTLINQIYNQSKEGKNLRNQGSYWWEFQDNNLLWWKEKWRRVIWYSSWQKIMAFLLTLVFGFFLVKYGNSIMEFVSESSAKVDGINNAEKGLTLNIFAKLIITVGATFGVLFSFAKFISIPFFIKSSAEATSFLNRASDPMEKIKKHFRGLVDDINSSKENNKRQLAVFIDDIDRCDKEFVVEFLEGIQTLFKGKRVLYIVAGDKKWITTSFGNTYKEFTADPDDFEVKNKLGENFLEKAFQLSFRMPNVSENAKKEYWNYILGIKNETEEERIDSVDKLDENLKTELEEELSTTEEDIADPDYMNELGSRFNLTGDTVSNIIIEEKNKDTEEIRHLLKDFHSLIDSNPRSIIRLANNYTMARSTLIAERKGFNTQKLFRWLVLEGMYPQIGSLVSNSENIDAVLSKLERMFIESEMTKYKILLKDEEGDYEGSLTKEEIKIFIG